MPSTDHDPQKQVDSENKQNTKSQFDLFKEKISDEQKIFEERIKSLIIEERIKSLITSGVDGRIAHINEFYHKRFYSLLRIISVMGAIVFGVLGLFGFNKISTIDAQIDQKIETAINTQNIPTSVEKKIDEKVKSELDNPSIKENLKKSMNELINTETERLRSVTDTATNKIVNEGKQKIDQVVENANQKINIQIDSAIRSFSATLSENEGRLLELLNSDSGKDLRDFIGYIQKSLEINITDGQELRGALQTAINNYTRQIDEQEFFVYLGMYENNQWLDRTMSGQGRNTLPAPSELRVGTRLTTSTVINARRSPPDRKNGHIILGEKIGTLDQNDVVVLRALPIKIDTNREGRDYFAIKVKKLGN